MIKIILNEWFQDYGKIVMKLVIYDGIVLWIDYKVYFEVCSDINLWNFQQKSLYLVVFLRGQVQIVFGNMRLGVNRIYVELCEVLELRFVFVN